MAEILVDICAVGCTSSRFYRTRDSEDNTANAIRQVSTNKLDDAGVFVQKVEVLASRHFARRHHGYLHSAVGAMESIWVRVVELEEMFGAEDGEDAFDFDDISYSVLEHLKFSTTDLVNVAMTCSRLAGPALNILWSEQPSLVPLIIDLPDVGHLRSRESDYLGCEDAKRQS
ncbi:hypothetical protein EV702DRAFT_1050492 [Suillus placidus]|uniref:Uncharacterized protein n=1 Tax=Suillus placidus TaxID=48579 RepID=A0A9P7CX03_9AGAM|nr:hypothetical protein EV702DRAFT_1050492 [Suillus placidus]